MYESQKTENLSMFPLLVHAQMFFVYTDETDHLVLNEEPTWYYAIVLKLRLICG